MRLEFIPILTYSGFFLIFCGCGCHLNEATRDINATAVVVRRLDVVSDDDYRRADEIVRAKQENDFARAVLLVARVLNEDDPWLIDESMGELAPLARNHGQLDRIMPLIKKCIESKDPLVRLVGYSTADLSDSNATWIKPLLESDYACILVRPEGIGSFRNRNWQSVKYLRRWQAATSLAVTRTHVIDLMAKYGIHEALPALRAIAGDDQEWHEPTVEHARAAIAELTDNDSARATDENSRNNVSKNSQQ